MFFFPQESEWGLFLVVSISLTFHLSKGDTLDCFSCTNLTRIENCHVTRQCLTNEYCYSETYAGSSGQVLYTLGCRAKTGIDQTSVFGRRAASQVQPGCQQCCGLHGCNKYLCPLRFTAAPPPVDGEWSDWASWGTCSPSCGIGLRFRLRNCDNPVPSSNGRLCLGDAKDVSLCNTKCTSDSPGSPAPTTWEPTTISPMTSPGFVTNDLTQGPGDCHDLIDCSGYYRPTACFGIYKTWASRYCPSHCGFCPTTSSPGPCTDAIPNCKEYQSDLCTHIDFWQWREANCRKFCNLC